MSVSAPSLIQPASAPVFTAHEGKVFRRDTYLAEPSRLLVILLEDAEGDDWFAARAAELACELRDAITVAEDFYPHSEREAA